MKPETNNLWEKALGYLEEAEQLSKDKEFHEAMRKAIEAFVAALQAINALSREMEMPELWVIGENAGLAWLEFMDSKHYTPKETVEWIRGRLKWLSDELPLDTFRPLK